ncbi:MAG: tetratricopeptide repeat protein [Planctomycetota bacterium]|nr:tetratricopeptide repeat protein [Planctomycetota bacterium]
MRSGTIIALAVVALLAPVQTLWAQNLGGVGGGPSTNFMSDLPSNNINRTLSGSAGGGYTSAGRFFNRPAPGQASYLASVGIDVNLMGSTYREVTFNDLAVGPGLGPLVGLKVRSIDSLGFDKRARFAKLRETILALAEKIREVDESSLSQISLGFRHFMFPMPLQNQPELGYGFFSRLDIAAGGSIKSDAFLAPFTQEVQQSLSDKRFLDATQALLFARPLPEGMALDQFYDTQLAALGNFLFNNSRYAAALSAWQILVDRDATNASASRAMALGLLATGQTKKAAAEVRRSLALMPGWPDKLRIVGSNFQDVFPGAKDIVGIREELTAQLAKAPDDGDLGLLMAFLDVFQGRVPEAEERLDKLAAADPAAKGLLEVIRRGGVAPSVKRPAETALRRAADEMTGLEEPAMSPEARAQLIAVLRSGATTYQDQMRLGDYRFFMGDYAVAGEAYRAAHKLKLDDSFALFAMAHAAYANGEYKQAVKSIGMALALEPNWGLYEFRIQEFYGDAADYKRQLKDLQRQVELRPKSADMKFLLAYVYYFSGRYSDAVDLLSDVLQRDPNFAGANYFLRLARLQG